MEELDIVIFIPDILPLVIVEFIMEVIEVVTMVEVDVGLNILATLPLLILEK